MGSVDNDRLVNDLSVLVRRMELEQKTSVFTFERISLNIYFYFLKETACKIHKNNRNFCKMREKNWISY
jgi:hypothetical protein